MQRKFPYYLQKITSNLTNHDHAHCILVPLVDSILKCILVEFDQRHGTIRMQSSNHWPPTGECLAFLA